MLCGVRVCFCVRGNVSVCAWCGMFLYFIGGICICMFFCVEAFYECFVGTRFVSVFCRDGFVYGDAFVCSEGAVVFFVLCSVGVV